MYQLFLLFVLAGDYALIKVIILGCVLIVLNFLAGWYSVKKLDTTSPYVMPYTQDYIKKDLCEKLILDCNQLAKMVNALINSLGKR